MCFACTSVTDFARRFLIFQVFQHQLQASQFGKASTQGQNPTLNCVAKFIVHLRINFVFVCIVKYLHVK